ncbi:MAG: hypothetical protein R3183_04350 [Oleiphilaceae bacterium]|nr:hypothetical protein [Oleiphilaceae bacterium]
MGLTKRFILALTLIVVLVYAVTQLGWQEGLAVTGMLAIIFALALRRATEQARQKVSFLEKDKP